MDRTLSRLVGLFTIAIFFCLFASCNKASEDLLLEERALIRSYFNNKGIGHYVEHKPSGYFYAFQNVANEASDYPNLNSVVELKYKGRFIDETIFYETLPDSTDLIKLRTAIHGLQTVLQKFKIGQEGIIVLPSRLAYGKKGLPGQIAPNSILIFEVEIVEIHPHF